MNRDEHIQWCKDRALEYLNKGDLANAVTSMGSDMDKHPETRANASLIAVGLMYAMEGDADGVRRFIEGYR